MHKPTAAPVLLAAAEELEVVDLFTALALRRQSYARWEGQVNDLPVTGILTGIGSANSAYGVGVELARQPYRRVVSLGFAGSFSQYYPPGTVVRVVDDAFADLGAEGPNGVLDLAAMGFHLWPEGPKVPGNLLKATEALELPGARVGAITVNTVGGAPATVLARKALGKEVETMEGAAVFLAAQRAGVPVVQLRAVSNYVAPRDEAQWAIPQAAQALQDYVLANIEALLG